MFSRWEFRTSAPQTQISSIAPLGDINQDGYDDLALGIRSISAVGARTVLFYGYAAEMPAAGGVQVIDLDIRLPIPSDPFGRPRYESYGPGSGDNTTRRLQLIGDVNGDGRKDLAIFDPLAPTGQAKNYVLFNPLGGLRVENLWNPGNLDGRTGFYLPGQVVDFAGDVNGDGLADVAVNTDTESFVVFGRRQGGAGTIDPATLDGSNGFRILGRTITGGGGDLNGDGRSELFLQGGTILFSQSRYPGAIEGAGFLTQIQEAQDVSRYALKSLGDLNQDGQDDWIVVENLNSNLGFRSHVFYGGNPSWSAQLTLNQANVVLWGGINDRGDFNNDGRLDVLTVYDQAPPGSRLPWFTEAFLTFGAADGWRSQTTAPPPLTRNTQRISARNVGDFNGDGIDDLLVLNAPPNAEVEQKLLLGGRLGFLPGEPPTLVNGIDLPIPLINGIVLHPLQPVGDVNGDGFADLAGGNIVLLGQGDRPPVTVNGGVYHHFQFPMANATPHDRLTFQSQPGQPDWVYGGRGNDTLIGASGTMDQFTGGPGADRFVLNREYGFQSGQGFVVVWDFEKGKDKVVVQGRPEDYFFVPDASTWLDNRNAPFLQHRGSDTSAVPNTLLARRHPELGAVMIATFSDVQLDPFDLIYL